jgi:2-polyprenyl-6-methoxyphenol hydroxylase-like FAD-dependent oxidoreductase
LLVSYRCAVATSMVTKDQLMAFDTQVLVVGGGPVGIFMAAELCRHGVACRVVDMNEGPRNNARASVIQPRTLEIFEHLGIVGRFLEAGVACPEVVITTPDLAPLRTVSYDELDSSFPFSLSLEQSKTERLLIGHLEWLGGKVERRVALRNFVQDTSGVTAVLDHADGSDETLRCEYLVACDGAHSTVRHSLGVTFEGEAKSKVFRVCEGRLEWRVPVPSNQIRFFVGADGQMFYGPFAEGRCLFSGDCDESEGTPPSGAEPSVEELQAMLEARTPGAKLSDVNWKAYFHVNLRQADRYSVDRVFLAGDAAHVQSPAGGQGMNTGIQDAHNLGWKLGLVGKGDARVSLLESYHPERHRAGKDMLLLNDYLYRSEMEGHTDLAPPEELKRHLAAILASQPVIQERMRRAVAELNINYRHSPIVARHRLLPTSEGAAIDPEAYHDFGAAPHAGDRVPDAQLERHPSGKVVRFCQVCTGTKHHLFLLAGRRANEETYQRMRELQDEIGGRYGRIIEVHVVVPHEVPPVLRSNGSLLIDPIGELHQRYGASMDCLYLIRPDGYIGFRSQPADAEALQSYLAKFLVEAQS